MDRLPLVLLGCLGLDLACTSAAPQEPAEPSTIAAAPTDASSSPPPQASRSTTTPHEDYTCSADHECVASCSQGAVNRAWYERMFPGGEACEDGCTSKGSEAPRCMAGTCVAYHDGDTDPWCTHVRGLVTEPQRPGPAHRCTLDDECRLSCTFGAVNTQWYELAPRHECKDGCASEEMRVICEKGRCAAYQGRSPYPACTERSIHRSE
ncbi:MAG: hypothetical protein R3B09_10220 [Nannocystaceae bacterium]